jgi:hypothetical protein
MKAVSIENRRNVGRLENGESRPARRWPCAAVDAAEFAEDRLAELEAVVDRRGLREIQQRPRQDRILDVDIDATDQIGGVFLLRQIAGRRTRGAALRENEDRRPVGIRPDKGIGMDRNKEVGLDSPCLLHPGMQRDEEIGIAGQHDAHVRLGLDPGAFRRLATASVTFFS